MTLMQKFYRMLRIVLLLVCVTILLIGYVFRVWVPWHYNELQRIFFVLFLFLCYCTRYIIKFEIWATSNGL